MSIDENTTAPQVGADGYSTVDTDKYDQGLYLRLMGLFDRNKPLAWKIVDEWVRKNGYYLYPKNKQMDP